MVMVSPLRESPSGMGAGGCEEREKPATAGLARKSRAFELKIGAGMATDLLQENMPGKSRELSIHAVVSAVMGTRFFGVCQPAEPFSACATA